MLEISDRLVHIHLAGKTHLWLLVFQNILTVLLGKG